MTTPIAAPTADDVLSDDELRVLQSATVRKPTVWERRAFVAGRNMPAPKCTEASGSDALIYEQIASRYAAPTAEDAELCARLRDYEAQHYIAPGDDGLLLAAAARIESKAEWEARAVRSMDAASKSAGVSCCDEIPAAIESLRAELESLRRDADAMREALRGECIEGIREDGYKITRHCCNLCHRTWPADAAEQHAINCLAAIDSAMRSKP